MSVALGRRVWVIADGFIPSGSTGPEPMMTSHEAMCVLDSGSEVAEIEIMIYFTDRDPVGPYRLTVEPRRTVHMRYNDLQFPSLIPLDTEYASVIRSSVPVVIQHSRLDSRQPANALLTTIGWAE